MSNIADEAGLHKIANNDSPDTKADIVFVHGLNGGAFSTWQSPGQGKRAGFFWPEELGKDFPNCAIWSLGYPAGVSHWVGEAGMSIQDRAKNLMFKMINGGLGQRPIVFITHSMGGLEVKQMMVRAVFGSLEHKRLVSAVRGIVFCGTPHRGSAFVSAAKLLQRFLRTQEHVRQMELGGAGLDELHDDFVAWREQTGVLIETYAERRNVFQKKWWKSVPLGLIVPTASANPGIPQCECIPVDEDHVSLVKPKNRSSDVYAGVFRFIQRVLETLAANPVSASSGFSIMPHGQEAPSASTSWSAASAPPFSGSDLHLQSLVPELAEMKEAELLEIQALIRAGNLRDAEHQVRQLMAARASWMLLQVAVRAKAYRLLIETVLRRRLAVDDATNWLEDAKRNCPGESFLGCEAHLAIATDKAQAFLDTLSQPVTKEEWQWRLRLLVFLERHQEALVEIENPGCPFEKDGTTWGIAAQAYLGAGDLDGAERANANALITRAESATDLEMKAILLYYRSVSPTSSGWLNPNYPTPLTVAEVDPSIATSDRLRSAAMIFHRLTAAADVNSPQWIRYKVWCLACCANYERTLHKTPAIPLVSCQSIVDETLAIDSTLPMIIAWALAYNLRFSLTAVEQRLRNEISTRSDTGPVEVLTHLLIANRRTKEAEELLDVHRERYAVGEPRSVWRFHRAQIAQALGDEGKADELVEDEGITLWKLRTKAFVLKHRGGKTGDRTPALTAFAELAAVSESANDLVFACQEHLYAGRFQFVVDQSDKLMTMVQGDQGFRMVLEATYQLQQWQNCLDLVSTYGSRFATTHDDLSIVRMSGECHRMLGHLRDACGCARFIADKSGSSQDRMRLFELEREAGNLDALFTIAQQVAADPGAPPEHRLHIANHLAATHRPLARALLSKAVTDLEQVEPNVAAQGVMIAHKLGQSKLADQLMERALQPGGPFVPVSLEQMKKWIIDEQQATTEQEEAYRLGGITTHLLLKHQNVCLFQVAAEAVPLQGDERKGFLHQRWSPRFRHGSRCRTEKLPDNVDKVFFDVTSLFLAHQLGVLAQIEANVKCIHLSASVPALLVAEISALKDHQESEVEKTRALLRLVDAKKLRVVPTNPPSTMTAGAAKVDETAKFVIESGGALATFCWSGRNDPFFINAEAVGIEGRVGSLKVLCDAIVSAGWITQSECEQLTHRHSSFLGSCGEITVSTDKPIVLAQGIAGCLHDTQLLHVLIAHCEVWITEDERKRWTATVALVDRKNVLAEQALALHGHLTASEHSGKYQSVSQPPRPEQLEGPNHPLVACCLDWCDLARGADVLTVCDDRFLNRFRRIGQSQIVGVLDLLHWLERKGAITKLTLYSCVQRLRRGNVRYVPIDDEELTWHLSLAGDKQEARFRESAELALIRSYYGAVLADSASMQMFREEELLDHNETRLTIELPGVVGETMANIWATDAPVQLRYARLNWLIEAMAFDPMNARPHPTQSKGTISTNLSWEGTLFMSASLKLFQSAKGEAIQKSLSSFAEWFFWKLPIAQLNRRAFGSALHDLIQIVMANPEKDHIRWWNIRLRIMLSVMPEWIYDHIEWSEAETDLLRIRSVTNLGEYSFPSTQIWNALEAAMTGSLQSQVTLDVEDDAFSISRLPESDKNLTPSLEFAHHDEAKRFVFTTQLLWLLDPETSLRRAFLDRGRVDLDLPEGQAGAVFDEIISIGQPMERMDRYHQLRRNSVTAQFRDILTEVEAGGSLTFGHIRDKGSPISTEALLRSARLPALVKKGGFLIALGDAAKLLVREQGVRAAFGRLAGLPVCLPKELKDAFTQLEPKKRERMIEQFTGPRQSPMHSLQMATWLLTGDQADQAKGIEVIERLAGPESKLAWQMHGLVLRWSWHCLVSRSGANESNTELVSAAWLHAGAFHLHLSTPNEVEPFNAEIQRWIVDEACPFVTPHFVADDVAHPLFFSYKRLMASALPRLIDMESVSDEIASRLRSVARGIAFDDPAGATQSVLFAELSAWWPNSLSSFLHSLDAKDVGAWFDGPGAEYLLPKVQAAQVTAWLKRDGLDAIPHDNLAAVTVMCSFMLAPPEFRDTFGEALARGIPSDFKAKDNRAVTAIGRFFVLQSYWFRSSDDEFWNAQFDALVAALVEATGPSDAASLGGNILEIAHHYSLRMVDRNSRAGAFATVLVGVARRHPQIAEHLVPSVMSLASAADIHLQTRLWPAITEARCIAARLP